MTTKNILAPVVAFALVAASCTQFAFAGVVVPPIKGGTNNDAQATGSTSNSVQQWKQAIATPPEAKLSERTRAGMQQALVTAWQAGRLQTLPPIAGSNGEILYPYGNSLPTLVTAPLHTSIIVLQPGSNPAEATGAPTSEWTIHTVYAGNQPELTIMPKFSGLHTDLVIPGTSATGKPLNYVIQITSDTAHYTPVLGFYYPDSDVRHWQRTKQAALSGQDHAKAMTVSELPDLSVNDLDFNWSIHCSGGGWFSNSDCSDVKPIRVFSDQNHTYLQFKPNQASDGGIPAIMAENNDGQPAIINTQFKDGYYIVDSVPHKILLISGKNSDKRIVKIVQGG